MMYQKILSFALIFSLTGCVSSQVTNSPTGGEVQAKQANIQEAAHQRLTLGLKYLEKGNLERAKFNLDRASMHAPESSEVMVGLAYYYQQVKEYELAEKYYQSSIAKSPNNGDNLNSYASFLCEQGQYKKASQLFMRAINLVEYAGAGASYENAGICAKRSGDLEKAKQYFNSALNYNSTASKSLLEMADITLQQKQFLQARAFLRQHFHYSKPNPRALWLGIQIERLLGDKDALSSYQLQLTGLFPDAPETLLYQSSK